MLNRYYELCFMYLFLLLFIINLPYLLLILRQSWRLSNPFRQVVDHLQQFHQQYN